jgi:hypothetical protein
LDNAKITSKVLADIHDGLARIQLPSVDDVLPMTFDVSIDFDLLGISDYPDQTREV